MAVVTPSGIRVPPLPQPRPRAHGKRRSLTMGLAAVTNPDGTVAWQEDDWTLNALHDAGEQDMLNVYLAGAANPSKYLALLSTPAGSLAETQGTMAAVTETQTPGSAGYNRIQIATTDWTNDGLVGGDYRFSAAEKAFGPAAASAWTITAAALTTTASTSAGLLLLTLALSASTTVAVGQGFRYILRWTQS